LFCELLGQHLHFKIDTVIPVDLMKRHSLGIKQVYSLSLVQSLIEGIFHLGQAFRRRYRNPHIFLIYITGMLLDDGKPSRFTLQIDQLGFSDDFIFG
jgi:hypothetical protein